MPRRPVAILTRCRSVIGPSSCWFLLVPSAIFVLRGEARGQESDLDSLLSDSPAAASAGRDAPEATTGGAETGETEAPAPDAAGGRRSKRVIEEIIVTAQKTEQSIQDVPISMSVVDDVFLEQQSVTDFRDISLYVPNVTISNNLQVGDVRIRGIGSTFGQTAFEQPVGLVIDGVPYGRLEYFRGPLFDLERVEVLRGPQGTLFGRNTTAGLLSVVTKQPTHEYTGSFGIELGELDRRRFEVAVGGPLVADVVDFRIAALAEERDGYMRNTTAAVVPDANPRDGGRERKALRAQLALPNLGVGRLNLSYELVQTDLTGTGFEFLLVQDSVKPFLLLFDPNADFVPHNRKTSIDRRVASTLDIDTFVGNAVTDVLGWELVAVGGYSRLTAGRETDVDFGPAPMLWVDPNDEQSDQASLELRTSSPRLSGLFGLGEVIGLALGASDLTTGFFYQHRKLVNHISIVTNAPVLAGFMAFQQLPDSGLPPIGPETTRAIFGTDAGIEEVTNDFLETSDALAGFGQMNWHLTGRFTLVGGLRYSHETKRADLKKEFTRGTGVAFTAIATQREFEASRDRSESALTPKVSATYAWSDDITVYAGWARGFEAGGFNAQVSNADREEAFAFDKELASSFELGARGTVLEGTARLNLSLYHHSVTDLQLLTQRPDTLEVVVANAGRARARGVEADANWLATDWLTFVGTLAFTDSEFLEFPLGGCSLDRPNTDGDEDERCDLTGQPFLRTPKWSSTIIANTRFPVRAIPGLSALPFLSRGGTDLVFRLTGEYWDTHFVADTFDPRERQDSFFRLGGSFGFESAERGWSLRLIGENLTDEEISVTARDIPLAGGSFVQVPEPPRLFFGSFRWSF